MEQDNISIYMEKAEAFFEKNRNAVLGGTVGVIVLVAGLIYVKTTWLPKREEAAQKALYFSQMYFEADSFNIALNGGSGKVGQVGFKDIPKKYSWTKAANLANFYAGICETNLGHFDAAIKYLDSYSPKDDVLKAQKYGLMGDCYMEKGDNEKGLSFYSKAADACDNELIAPLHLMKAGLACEKSGKKEEALKFYNRIKSDFPRSEEFREIDKFIARVQ